MKVLKNKTALPTMNYETLCKIYVTLLALNIINFTG